MDGNKALECLYPWMRYVVPTLFATMPYLIQQTILIDYTSNILYRYRTYSVYGRNGGVSRFEIAEMGKLSAYGTAIMIAEGGEWSKG